MTWLLALLASMVAGTAGDRGRRMALNEARNRVALGPVEEEPIEPIGDLSPASTLFQYLDFVRRERYPKEFESIFYRAWEVIVDRDEPLISKDSPEAKQIAERIAPHFLNLTSLLDGKRIFRWPKWHTGGEWAQSRMHLPMPGEQRRVAVLLPVIARSVRDMVQVESIIPSAHDEPDEFMRVWGEHLIRAWGLDDEDYKAFVLRAVQVRPDPSSPLYYILRHIEEYWRDIFDWIEATHPDVSAANWAQALAGARAWHAALATSEKKGLVSRRGVPVARWEDGAQIVRLLTRKDVEDEGHKMGHCVGTYWQDVVSGATCIFSYRDPQGRPLATLEIPNPDEVGSPTPARIEQAKGPDDETPIPNETARLRVRAWLYKVGMLHKGGEVDDLEGETPRHCPCVSLTNPQALGLVDQMHQEMELDTRAYSRAEMFSPPMAKALDDMVSLVAQAYGLGRRFRECVHRSNDEDNGYRTWVICGDTADGQIRITARLMPTEPPPAALRAKAALIGPLRWLVSTDVSKPGMLYRALPRLQDALENTLIVDTPEGCEHRRTVGLAELTDEAARVTLLVPKEQLLLRPTQFITAR